MTVTQLAAAFGQPPVSPFLDMAANQVLLSQKIGELLGAEFAKLGLALENFTVESISLPASIQAALDKKNFDGALSAIWDATPNIKPPNPSRLRHKIEGGLAGIGAGLGVGAGIGQAMAGAMSGMMQPNVQPRPTKCSAGCRRSAGEIVKTQVFARWRF